MKLEELIVRLKNFKVQEIIPKIIKENEAEIKNLITKEQIYNKGIRGTGDKIVPLYTEAYRKRKENARLYQGYVDLNLSGDYLKSFYFEYKNGECILQSDRMENGFNLSEHLKGRYNESIEEFTEENEKKLENIIRDGLKKEVEKLFGLL